MAFTICGRNKHHLLTSDELDHLLIQATDDLSFIAVIVIPCSYNFFVE